MPPCSACSPYIFSLYLLRKARIRRYKNCIADGNGSSAHVMMATWKSIPDHGRHIAAFDIKCTSKLGPKTTCTVHFNSLLVYNRRGNSYLRNKVTTLKRLYFPRLGSFFSMRLTSKCDRGATCLNMLPQCMLYS